LNGLLSVLTDVCCTLLSRNNQPFWAFMPVMKDIWNNDALRQWAEPHSIIRIRSINERTEWNELAGRVFETPFATILHTWRPSRYVIQGLKTWWQRTHFFLVPEDTVKKIRVQKKKGFFYTGSSPYRNGFENQSIKRKTVILKHPVNCTVAASFRFPAVVSQ